MRKIYQLKGAILLGIVLGLLLLFTWKIGHPVYSFAKRNSLDSSFFSNMFFDKELPLKKTDGRTNVLILGIAGGDHAGSDLTDTMLFLSFDQQNKKTYVISIPRDVWSDTLRDKVNSAYHYGEEKKEGGGLVLTDAVIEEILGQNIHYAFLIDFQVFQEMIDLLDGVEVNVENSFDDYKFPIPGKENDPCDYLDPEYMCRYEHIRFDKGRQVMNGETALKFIRSRNAQGEEGSDFARGKRQQKLLEALKNKITSKEVMRNPKLLVKIWHEVEEKTKSNANFTEIAYLGKIFLSEEQRVSIPIEEKLVTGSAWLYDGRWVLVPRKSWQDFHQFIKESLEQ